MATRVRIRQVREAVKDLNYVVDYIEEWKNEEHIKPVGTHQQRYQLIEVLTRFALDKLENELRRQENNGDTSLAGAVDDSEAIDNTTEE